MEDVIKDIQTHKEQIDLYMKQIEAYKPSKFLHEGNKYYGEEDKYYEKGLSQAISILKGHKRSLEQLESEIRNKQN